MTYFQILQTQKGIDFLKNRLDEIDSKKENNTPWSLSVIPESPKFCGKINHGAKIGLW